MKGFPLCTLLTISALMLLSSKQCFAVTYKSFRVFAPDDVVLPCWELTNPEDFVLWMTPSEVAIGPLYSSSKYSVHPDGSLTVNDTMKNDTGNYKCIVKSESNEYKITESTLEVIDTSYLPEIDDWQRNLTRALITFGCTAAFFIGACGFAHFNWETRHPKKRDSESTVTRPSDPSSATSSDPSTATMADPSARKSSDPSAPIEMKGIDNPALAVDTTEIDSGM